MLSFSFSSSGAHRDLHSFLHDALPIFGGEHEVSAPLGGGERSGAGQGPRAMDVDANERQGGLRRIRSERDRKSTRLNSSHMSISYAGYCLKKKMANQCSFTSLTTRAGR